MPCSPSGGCSGFSYQLELDTTVEASDVVNEFDGVRLVIDADSMEKVSGGFGGLAVEFVPSEMIKLPVPLHPGAIRYYREKGLLPATTE